MFLGEEKGERVSHVRAAELAATGASVVGAACPFCNTMFRDALAREGRRCAGADGHCAVGGARIAGMTAAESSRERIKR